MKIIFMGTPDFTIPILDAILSDGHEIIEVVTQPDKPKNRGQKLLPPPAKVWAEKHDIPVYQPEKIREPEAVAHVTAQPLDLIVVAAFGQILPKEILEFPAHGCWNVHASLLPKYRGASPIQWAILNGDETTGVTIMKMGEGLDDGDILLQRAVPISPEDTGGSLFDTLALLGGQLLKEAMQRRHELTGRPQDESKATKVGLLKKSVGRMDFTRPAIYLERQVRGLSPWPGAYTSLNGKTLKIWDTEVITELEAAESGLIPLEANHAKPGETIASKEGTLIVRTGEGFLILWEVQLEGKKRMHTAEFLRGHTVEAGTLLGE